MDESPGMVASVSTTTVRRRLNATLAIVALGLSACGGDGERGGRKEGKTNGRSDRLVDLSATPPFVNDLDVDPATGDYLLTTNRGFWRIDPATKRASRIEATLTAGGLTSTLGTFLSFTVVDDKVMLGSGHPDQKGTLPEFLGFIRSDDGGQTWQALSRLGEADLHKIVDVDGTLFAFDAVLGALLISKDGGRTFEERFTPRGLIIDFVIDPKDPKFILAATESEMYRSEDQGRGWKPVASATGARLEWPEPGVVLRADADGTVYRSTDRGTTWNRIGEVPDEPYKFHAVDARNLLLALADGTITGSDDQGETWKVAFRP